MKAFEKQRMIIRGVTVVQVLFFIVLFVMGFAGWGFCKGKFHFPYAWLGFNIIFLVTYIFNFVVRLKVSANIFQRFKSINWRSKSNLELLRDMQDTF